MFYESNTTSPLDFPAGYTQLFNSDGDEVSQHALPSIYGNPEILYANVLFSPYSEDLYEAADDIYLEKVVLHEFGHVLGLGHCNCSRTIDSIMRTGSDTNALFDYIQNHDIDELEDLLYEEYGV